MMGGLAQHMGGREGHDLLILDARDQLIARRPKDRVRGEMVPDFADLLEMLGRMRQIRIAGPDPQRQLRTKSSGVAWQAGRFWTAQNGFRWVRLGINSPFATGRRRRRDSRGGRATGRAGKLG